MSLFFFRDKGRLKQLDKSSTSSDVLILRDACQQDQYETFVAVLNDSQSDTAIELAIKFPDCGGLAQKYASQYPDSADAHFLYANHLIAKAWEARGSSAAHTVSQDQVSAFYSFLNAAQEELHRVARLDTDYKAIYAPLIAIQMGKSDHSMAMKIYNQAVKCAPSLLDYHIARLTMLAPKWGGSFDEMFRFARENAEHDETGLLHGLIFAAHFEQWYDLEGKEARRYFNDKKVVEEVEHAYLEVEHVELTDNFYDQYQYFLAMNYSALVMLLMNKGAKARKTFKAIGSNYTRRPWVNMGKEPGLAFLKYKKLA